MFKDVKWQAAWNGHTIEVLNWSRIYGMTGETLKIDGVVAYDHKSFLLFGGVLSGELHSELLHEGEVHRVKARIGQKGIFAGLGCHIFVDDQLIGGDVDRDLNMM